MDFPLKLDTPNPQFALGIDEFKQVVTMLLKTPVRKFFQSMELGSMAPIHGSEDVMEVGIRETIKQIPNTEIVSLLIDGDVVDLVLKYKDDIVNFQYSIEV